MLRRLPSGFFEPCRPTKALSPPAGPLWIHEIKHDGYRLIVRKYGARVWCFTRGGHDWSDRYPAIVEAARKIKAQSFTIDGEAIVARPDGISDFAALHSRRRDMDVTMVAFDIIELRGQEVADETLAQRKRRLHGLLHHERGGIILNEHMVQDGAKVFSLACKMGLEGIVSKRLDAPYRSGPSKTWLKTKNPLSEAVLREKDATWDHSLKRD